MIKNWTKERVRVHHGQMSASDAAPLPRLGEVFFDVRGESRTMRLSWYADTGVAVFSIWQGGTCTGTFRLPIADLPRMVEALRRGPHGHDDQITGEHPGSREPGPPGLPASSRPELLDHDIQTGQITAALHAPQTGPGQTGYQAGPDHTGYQAGPDQAGYQNGPDQAGPDHTGYPAAPDHPGYQAGPDHPGYQAGPGHTDYQSGPRPPGYGAEPPGPSGGYPDQPSAGDTDYQTSLPPRAGHRGKASRRRRGSPPAPPAAAESGPGHRDADLAGDSGEYPAGLAPDFPGEYPAGPPAADFTAPRGSRHRGRGRDDDPGAYFDEPSAPGLPHEYSGGYEARPEAGYPGEAPEGYQAEPGYLDEEDLGGYQAEPAYLDEQDYPGYPDELPAEYGPPARSYPADAPGTDELFADDPPEPAKRRGRRRAEPTPDSFPYGPPPGSGGSQQREGYPRRH
jgi:hypothetical protein